MTDELERVRRAQPETLGPTAEVVAEHRRALMAVLDPEIPPVDRTRVLLGH